MACLRTVPVDSIQLGPRIRKDAGDLDALAASIRELGLLQPLVVNSECKLIAGERRLEVVKRLGWKEVDVREIQSLDDLLLALRAERDENTCRKDFTPSEAVAIGREIEGMEREEARKRQQEHGGTAPGRRKENTCGKLPQAVEPGKSRDKTAEAVGMSGRTYEKAKAVVEAAEQEPDRFGALLEQMDRTGKVDGAYKKLKVEKAAEEIKAEPPPLPAGPFRVLVVDPPWSYGARAEDVTHRSANPYPGMSIEAITALPVNSMACDDCVLWLWTTNAYMREAHEIAAAWGFAVKTILTWAKDRMGTGDWLRGQTEHCLMCVRGKPTVTLSNQTTLLKAALREHSRKPEEFYALVESLCPGSKCELFARAERPGWVTHGNQTTLFSAE